MKASEFTPTNELSRITARVTQEVKERLSMAATLSGISSINSFILNAALEKADEIIKREESIRLSSQDSILFVEALDRPAQLHPKLKEAFNQYETEQIKL